MNRQLVMFVALAVIAVLGVGWIARLSVGFGVDEVAGVYECEYPYGIEVVRLNKDGGYSQSVRVFGVKTLEQSGRWSLSESKVVMEDAIVIDDGLGRMAVDPSRKGLRMLAVETGGKGKVRLLVNEDLGLYLKRRE